MTYLKLHFSAANSPELLETEFYHPNIGHPVKTVRGKTVGALSGDGVGTFQWTKAVQGMTSLLLRSAATHSQLMPNDSSTLTGERGSLAASLDFALGKPPTWLIEMFGWDRQGTPFAKKLFKRTNPELKHTGPCSISLNYNLLQPEAIAVYVGGKEASDHVSVSRLISDLGDLAASPIPSLTGPESASPSDEADLLKWLETLFVEESISMFYQTDIFSRPGLNEIRRQISDNEIFNSIVGDGLKHISSLFNTHSADLRLALRDRLPQLLKQIEPLGKLRVAVPGGKAGDTPLLYYLKYWKGLPIEIDFQFQHAIAIRRALYNREFIDPPHLCCIGIAPAASMLREIKRYGYRPLMFGTAMAHRLIAPNTASQLRERSQAQRFIFLDSEPSTSRFYYSALSKSRQMQRGNIKIEHGDPDDVFVTLHSGDNELRSIVYFPHFDVNIRYNNCIPLDDMSTRERLQQNIFFVHDSLSYDPLLLELLELAIRSAWLDLREDRKLLTQVVRRMLREPGFIKYFKRCAGLYLNPTLPRAA